METKEKEQVTELIISYEQQGMKRLVQTMARKGTSLKDIADVTDLAEIVGIAKSIL